MSAARFNELISNFMALSHPKPSAIFPVLSIQCDQLCSKSQSNRRVNRIASTQAMFCSDFNGEVGKA